jgi:hypothetical protein
MWLFAKGAGEKELAIAHIRLHLNKDCNGGVCVENHGSLLDFVKNWIDKSRQCYHTEYLYFVCQLLKPLVVVETGVHYGASTAFMLKALNEFGGHLYSVDLPNVKYLSDDGEPHYDMLVDDLEPGFVVPQELRSNWNLILGDSREKLPELLKALGRVDLFHHDSMHTYEVMMFEFETVWPYLSVGGVMLADDVEWNDAFVDFCKEHQCDWRTYRNKGIAIKD